MGRAAPGTPGLLLRKVPDTPADIKRQQSLPSTPSNIVAQPLQGPPEAKKPEPKAVVPVHVSKFAPRKPQKAASAEAKEAKEAKEDEDGEEADKAEAPATTEVHHGMTYSEWAAAQISKGTLAKEISANKP